MLSEKTRTKSLGLMCVVAVFSLQMITYGENISIGLQAETDFKLELKIVKKTFLKTIKKTFAFFTIIVNT